MCRRQNFSYKLEHINEIDFEDIDEVTGAIELLCDHITEESKEVMPLANLIEVYDLLQKAKQILDNPLW